MIPKKIHYCWLSDDPFPADIQGFMDTWKSVLTDYEFILWDKERFDISSSLWCQQAYEAKKYAFAADFIRMYAIYTEGGIYLDADIEVLKSFDNLLDNDIMMAYEQKNKKVIEAGCFGATKNHPFIKKCLEYYEGRSFLNSNGSYDMKFLPEIMYEIMQGGFDEKQILKFPPTVFTSKSSIDGSINITNEHYCIHHFNSHYLDKKVLQLREKNWKMRQKNNSLASVLRGKISMFNLLLKQEGIKEVIKRYKNSIF